MMQRLQGQKPGMGDPRAMPPQMTTNGPGSPGGPQLNPMMQKQVAMAQGMRGGMGKPQAPNPGGSRMPMRGGRGGMRGGGRGMY